MLTIIETSVTNIYAYIDAYVPVMTNGWTDAFFLFLTTYNSKFQNSDGSETSHPFRKMYREVTLPIIKQ